MGKDIFGLGMDAATSGLISAAGGIADVVGGFFGGKKGGQDTARKRADLTQGFQGMQDTYNPWMQQMQQYAQPYIQGAQNMYGQMGNMLSGQNPFASFNVANAVRQAGAGQAAAGNLLSGQGGVAREQAGMNMGNQMQQQWLQNQMNYTQMGLGQQNAFEQMNTGMTSQLGQSRYQLGRDLAGAGGSSYNPFGDVAGALGGSLMNYGIMTAPRGQQQV